MKEGEIVQCDTPARIYDAPASRFVGSFIGSPPMNFLTGTLRTVEGRLFVEAAGGRVAPSGIERTVSRARGDGTVIVGIRPEHIDLALAPSPESIVAHVIVMEPIGPQKLLTVRAGEETLKVTASLEFHAEEGQQIWLRLNPARIRLMDAATGAAIPA